jgi:hypothetical protein
VAFSSGRGRALAASTVPAGLSQEPVLLVLPTESSYFLELLSESRPTPSSYAQSAN